MNRHFRGEAVELAEGFGFAVFDELVRPADPLDRRVDAGVVEIFNHRGAEAVEQDVVFEGADDFAFPGEFLEHGGVERLDEARVDERDRESLRFEL